MDDARQVLFRYPPEFCPERTEPLGAAGGMSGAQFWRVVAPRGVFILRRWPREHPIPERLQFIHAVLQHAVRRGFSCVPVPIRATSGESFVDFAGHLWELAPWMPGTADYEQFPSVAKLQAALQALAKFHLAVADFRGSNDAQPKLGRSPAVVRRLERLQQLARDGREQLGRVIDDGVWPELATLARKFLVALPAALPRALVQLEPLANVSLPLQPCVRDIWHDHVLFTGDEVTGLIDFGAVDIDTPAVDIARLLGSLTTSSQPHCGEVAAAWQTGATTWREGLAAYATIRRLTADELRAVSALDSSGTILAGCNWVRWVFQDGRRFESPTQVVARLRRITARAIEFSR